MTDVSDRAQALVIGEHGADASSGGALGNPGIEPIAQSIGQLLVALGELTGRASNTAEVRLGGFELRYHRLDRPRGPIELRDLDDDSAETPPLPVTDSRRHGDSDVHSEAGAWELGVNAVREGLYSEALAHFGREAEEAAEAGSDGRAAIAYRSASAAADKIGRYDLANRLLRLAGKHYLNVGETRDTPLRGVRQAYETAAKCFLQAGNLELAETSIRRARSLDDVLG